VSSGTSRTTGEPQELPTAELTLTHLDTLPTLAPIAVKLLQVTTDEASSAPEVVELLHGDQSLSAKILSIANSAALGSSGRIRTLDRAVVLLGFKAVRGIVLAVKVFECLGAGERTGKSRRFDRVEFWKHSLGVACAARRLAERRSTLAVDREEAFVAGLLHDLGKVALSAVFPRAYDRVAAHAEDTRSEIADCERAILAVDHTVAGRHVARRWGLPRYLQDVIWLHHVSAEVLPDRVTPPALIALVQLANAFVREQRIGQSGSHALYEPPTRLAEHLGFAEADLATIAPDVIGEVAQYAALLGIDQDTPEDLYLKSLTRANAELGRLNNELLSTNRRLSAAARHFEGITQFDRQLSARSDLSEVVVAIADAAMTALQRTRLAAFGVHDRRVAVELCCVGDEPPERTVTTERLTEEMREWLHDPRDVATTAIMRAPAALHSMLRPVLERLGAGDCWLLPIVHDEQVAGGIVLVSERDEPGSLSCEKEELRSFLTSLGLALGRANAQTAARRLSEDLAESNRRLQRMQAEVLRTRTLSIIAEMAAGAGHELNGPLTVISGRAQLLMDKTPDLDARRALDQIRSKAHECAQIVKDLMDFAQPRPPAPSAVDLGALLTEVRDAWLERTGLPPARLRVNLPDDPRSPERPVLLVDRDQIRTVLDEVLENAVEAVSANQGNISIQCHAGIPDPISAARPAVPGGHVLDRISHRWIEITVHDTGCGMTSAVVQRVFDPFFSHRTAGRGRGLGLARAHRIVEAHGGRIWAVSHPAEGTVFHILLPQAGDERACPPLP
jgi:putative nucleotidyltransferase with HDIG domain